MRCQHGGHRFRHLAPRKRCPDHAASPGRLAWGKVRPQLRLGGRDRGAPRSAFGRMPFDRCRILTDMPSGTRPAIAPGMVHLSFRRGAGPGPPVASIGACAWRAGRFPAPVRQGAEMRQGAENGSPAENPSRGTAICPLYLRATCPVPARHRDRRGWGRKLLSRTPVCCKGTCE